MVKSYENFDKPYRRGLILGLYLAELFLILLFLLLLVSMGISSELKEEKKQTAEKLELVQKEIEDLKDKLSTMEDILGGVITLEELRRLVASDAARKKLIRDNEKLNEDIDKLEERLAEFEDIEK